MKRFILFLIITAGIGVGIFVLTVQEEENAPEQQVQPQTNESGDTASFELSEAMIQNIMKDALGTRFNAETAIYKVANLDHKGGPELIIGAATGNTASIQVLTIKNGEGEYERIGKIEYQELIREAPEVKELADIDGNGQDEIIMSLMYGGAASVAEGILNVDFAAKAMHWVQLRDERGELQDAIFLLANTVSHHNRFHIQDVDKDGIKEITEIFAETLYNEKTDSFDVTNCEASVYEWDGILFVFDAALSEQTLRNLGKDCAM